MKKLLAVSLIILIATTLGCSKQNSDNINGKNLKVAVSIVPQATFVKAVGNELVDVVTMIPPGNSPANYEVTPKKMEDLSKSSIYFAIGVPAEKANILPEINNFNESIKIVDLSKAVEEVYPVRYFSDEEIHEHDGEIDHEGEVDDDERDQHIWLSPKRVKIMVEKIANELSRVDPDNKEIYISNAKIYIDKLDALDKEITETVSKMSGKSFLIYHPSFGYFADDYGLKMISVEKEGKEATAKELKEIVDFAREKEIKVVFYQAEIHNKQARVLATEIGGESIELTPLSGNYIENLRNILKVFEDTL